MAPCRSEPDRARAVFVDQGLVVGLECLDVRMLVRLGVPASVMAIVSWRLWREPHEPPVSLACQLSDFACWDI